MSKVTHMLAFIVLTPCFCFASSVRFSSFKNLILSGFARDWCRFPSRRLPYTSICLSISFFEIDVCVFLSLLSLFVILHSGTTWFKYRFSRVKSIDHFVCCLSRSGLDQPLFRFCRELKKTQRWRLGKRWIKSEFIFYLRISRYSKIIYFVYHCENFHKTEPGTQR